MYFLAISLVFEQYSDFWCTTSLQSLSNEETLAGKQEYNSDMNQYGVMVDRYHAHNSSFSSNSFLLNNGKKDKEMSFCGIGAHYLNVVVENGNKRLITSSHIIFLHTKKNIRV